jgi:1-acyl-sn-glycerol-3-phosphate acyltransferase
MRPLRSLFRIFLFLKLSLATTAYLLIGLAARRIAGKTNLEDRAWIHTHFVKFVRRVHRIMGMRISWEGQLPDEPAVLMGNHRSYMDGILFPVGFPVVFVARKETKSWPIIGWGATLIGTIWVDRKSKESRTATRKTVRNRLAEGMGIVIFPEGTTHRGPDLLEYRPGMFYTCAEEGFPIVPVALEYGDPDIAWVGNSWFIPHAFHHLGAKHLDVAVRFGNPIHLDDAEQLRKHVRDWTSKTCLELRAQLDATRR